ncbi:MAG: hypothetical protein IT481_08590 [Gammaproteobacteria bacterium]|nr:hypothetical protein [Gammaproteobacteria bacterium]
MAKVHAPLLAFNRGEVSKAALARVDIDKMRFAAEAQVNWSPLALGDMMVRPGTGYLCSTRSDAAAFGIPFVYGTSDAAILELTDSHLRVIVADALVTRAAVSTAVTNGDFSSGAGWTLSPGTGAANINSTVAAALYLAAGSADDRATCERTVTIGAGDQNVAQSFRISVTRGPVLFSAGSSSGATDYIAKAELGTGTHSLVLTPTGATVYVRFEAAVRHGVIVDAIAIDSAGALDLPAPWLAADLGAIRYDQSGDIVFIACDGYQPRKIERRAHNSWSIVTYDADDGPFGAENVDTTAKIQASAIAGSITLAGTNTQFSADDVGSIIQLSESDYSVVAEWKGSETISIPTSSVSAAGTKIGDMTNLANAFDGNSATFADKTSTTGYAGTNQASPSAIYSAAVTFNLAGNITAYLYGKTGGSPASGTDGTLLGTVVAASGGGSASDVAVTLYASHTSTTWDYQWIYWVVPSSTSVKIKEITRTTFSSGGAPVLRRYNGNVYQALSGTTTGVNPPSHTFGDVLSETGGTVWRYRHGRSGSVRITAVASAVAASGDVVVAVPDSIVSRATSLWAKGEWSIARGWPTEVKFHEGRLWWFRGDKYWGSVSDAYYSFDAAVEGDSGTIARTFGSGPVDKVNFALSLTRLVAGREGSVDTIRGSSQDETLTPTNLSSRPVSGKGTAELPALKVGTRAAFVERSGRRIMGLVYSVEAGDYVVRDLTRLNDVIGVPGFASVAVQEEPATSLHFVRADGVDAILLDDPGEEIACWWRVMTLGVIERIVILPGALEDRIYYVVKRTINGSTKRYWEKVALRTECVGGTLNKVADCHLVVAQASSTTISGLSHLEGANVVVWANGKDLGSYTVAAGAITVSEAVTSAIVGLGGVAFSYDSAAAAASVSASSAYDGYPAEVFADGKHVGAVTVSGGVITLPRGRTARKITAYLGLYAPFRSSKLAYGAQMGTALTQSKRIGAVGLVAFDLHYQGLKYGTDVHDLQPLPLAEGGQDVAADTVWTELDRPMIGLPGSWDTDSRLHLLGQAPRPATLAGVVVGIGTSESH